MITSLSTPVNDQDVLEGTGLDDKDAVSWIEDSNPLRSRFYLGVPKRASVYNYISKKSRDLDAWENGSSQTRTFLGQLTVAKS